MKQGEKSESSQQLELVVSSAGMRRTLPAHIKKRLNRKTRRVNHRALRNVLRWRGQSTGRRICEDIEVTVKWLA